MREGEVSRRVVRRRAADRPEREGGGHGRRAAEGRGGVAASRRDTDGSAEREEEAVWAVREARRYGEEEEGEGA
jgi:hypothetical protein